ncbi:Asp/Glu racemase [Xanthobacter sp. KR7-225]|uniref:maleate cis-trans isomerase family protein n=1 Tax=Xanthobacter sp. KR7-225 TaxID=3156613 RepID=UPI0032B3D0A5
MTIVTQAAGRAGLIANIEDIPFEMDSGVGSAANLGLVVLRTDQTIEDEFRFVVPDRMALYEVRLPSPVEITPENLSGMEADIPAAVALLPDVRFDVIGFGCTSGALVIGEANVARRVNEVKPETAVTDPITAAIAAFRALGVTRIGLLTPYIESVNHALREAFIARGVEIPVMGSFNEPDDNRVARIAPEAIERAVLEVGASDECDAVFVSCTSLRVARIVARIEDKLGKPVTSSNHALAWHMLFLAGHVEAIQGLGKLYTRFLNKNADM